MSDGRNICVSILERSLEHRSFEILYSSNKGLVSLFESMDLKLQIARAVM